MVTLSEEQLDRLARRLLVAGGAPEDIAAVVAGSLVGSNLRGVDSHGVMNLPWYLQEMAEGKVDPTARPDVEIKAPSAGLVRGNGGFGIYAMGRAAELAVELARTNGSAAVGLANCSHTGRVGHFAEQAAAQGCLAVVFGGGAHRIWSNVVPHGGRRPIMSTNPYALALPVGRFGTVLADFATSTASDGKIGVLRAEGKTVPEGWILDKDGQPTSDPDAFFDDGMHLPAAGHKGYGLGLIAELVGDALLATPPEYNWMVLAVNIATFRSPDAFAESAEDYLQWVKDTPPAEGVAEVLLPGEPERRTAARRQAEGIAIPERVWQELSEAAAKLEVSLED